MECHLKFETKGADFRTRKIVSSDAGDVEIIERGILFNQENLVGLDVDV